MVPSGTTLAYIQPYFTNALSGQVQVRLDNPTTGTVGQIFTNRTGMDIVDSGSNTNFTFVDQVPAYWKPTSDGADNGIKVQGASGATLKIDETGNNDDTYIKAETVSTATTVTVTDTTSHVGRTRLGSGVGNLVIRTNDVVASDYYMNDGDGTYVSVPKLGSGIHLTVDTGAGTYDEVILASTGAVAEQAMIKTGAGHEVVELGTAISEYTSDALVDFAYAGALGLGNDLYVYSNGNAHLDNAPGTSSHSVYVDSVHTTASTATDYGTVSVDHASVIGALNIGILSEATIAAPSTIGEFTVNGIATFTSDSYGTTVRDFAGAGDVTVEGGAAITIEETSTLGVLSIEDTGAVTVSAHDSSSDVNVLAVQALNIDVGETTAGTLDLTNNAMIIDYGGSNPEDTVRMLITLGYSGGSWGGYGITSSSAAAHANDTHRTSLGYAEIGEEYLNIEEFAGYAVDDTTVVIRYTWAGDCNLDGGVDLADFYHLQVHLDMLKEQTWLLGDVDYDGDTDLNDFTLLITNFNASGYPT
jgi:hypothetical protein